MFNHFILTRISVYHSKNGILSDAWYHDRIKHIENVFAPSIESQTVRDFKVIGGISENSPAWFVARLQQYGWLKLFTKKSMEGADLPDWIAAMKPDMNQPWVMTTRIDTDDAINKTFIEKLHQAFEPRRMAINFDKGIVMSRGRSYELANTSNPFITLIERTTEARTVYCGGHGEIAKRIFTKHLSEPTMFLVNTHGFNRRNSFSNASFKCQPYVVNFADVFGVKATNY
jgi:hypothetical protein